MALLLGAVVLVGVGSVADSVRTGPLVLSLGIAVLLMVVVGAAKGTDAAVFGTVSLLGALPAATETRGTAALAAGTSTAAVEVVALRFLTAFRVVVGTLVAFAGCSGPGCPGSVLVSLRVTGDIATALGKGVLRFAAAGAWVGMSVGVCCGVADTLSVPGALTGNAWEGVVALLTAVGGTAIAVVLVVCASVPGTVDELLRRGACRASRSASRSVYVVMSLDVSYGLLACRAAERRSLVLSMLRCTASVRYVATIHRHAEQRFCSSRNVKINQLCTNI